MKPHRHLQRIFLGIIGAVGSGIFAFFLALTFHTPEWVEEFAAGYIETEVSKRVDTAIDSIQPPKGEAALSRAAKSLYVKNEEAIEHYRKSLREKVHERMADAIAEARDLDCECRDKWAEWLKNDASMQISLLQKANQGITDFVQSNYAKVVSDLKRDIRIFTSANGLVFFLILLLVVIKPEAWLQIFVPSLLATLATLICSYFYIFEQNWLLTIIFNDYLGFTYIAYLVIVFGLLCDITFNRARITTEILNAGLNVVGSTVSAVPC